MRDLKSYSHKDSEGVLADMLMLALLLGIPFLLFLGYLPLIDPDEGRYAEIPREMLLRGDLITPTLNYVKYFEKPPLLYWLNAAAMQLFGPSEFSARLPSALSGLLTVLATYLTARRLYQRRTAILAALILGTSLGFVLQSRIILTDMLLTFCLTGALGAFIVTACQEARSRSRSGWYLFYFFCALAVLTKGLIGIVFPGGIIFFYLLLSRRWHVLARMRLFSGTLLFLAVAAPWFIAVSLANSEFPHFFFIHEHFERFTSTVHGRYQPFWFFVPILAVTMLPWSFYIPAALAKAWRERRFHNGDPGLFMLVWSLLIFLFFSKSSSKLIPYLLPIFPPLAMLIAHRFSQAMHSRGEGSRFATILLGTVLIIVGAAAIGYGYLPQAAALLSGLMPKLNDPLNQFIRHAPQLSTAACITVGALFLAQGVSALVLSARKPAALITILCICSFALEIIVPLQIMGPIARSESPRELAVKAAELATPDTKIITFGPMQAVNWYMQRRVMVSGKIDELEFGSQQGDQAAWFPDRQAIISLWGSSEHVLMMLKPHELKGLQQDLHPEPRVIVHSARRVLVSNR